MRAAHVLSLLVSVIALSGCVGDDVEPGPTGAPEANEDPAGDTIDAALVNQTEMMERVPVTTPVSLEGESPPGVWVCAASPALGQCEVIQTQDTTYMFDVPFEGALANFELTITSPPLTPENPGMLLNLRVEDGEEVTWLNAEGPSPLTFSMTDLEFSDSATLRITAYTMPDADVGGNVWVDPLPQPYTIEGSVTGLVPAS